MKTEVEIDGKEYISMNGIKIQSEYFFNDSCLTKEVEHHLRRPSVVSGRLKSLITLTS